MGATVARLWARLWLAVGGGLVRAGEGAHRRAQAAMRARRAGPSLEYSECIDEAIVTPRMFHVEHWGERVEQELRTQLGWCGMRAPARGCVAARWVRLAEELKVESVACSWLRRRLERGRGIETGWCDWADGPQIGVLELADRVGLRRWLGCGGAHAHPDWANRVEEYWRAVLADAVGDSFEAAALRRWLRAPVQEGER